MHGWLSFAGGVIVSKIIAYSPLLFWKVVFIGILTLLLSYFPQPLPMMYLGRWGHWTFLFLFLLLLLLLSTTWQEFQWNRILKTWLEIDFNFRIQIKFINILFIKTRKILFRWIIWFCSHESLLSLHLWKHVLLYD